MWNRRRRLLASKLAIQVQLKALYVEVSGRTSSLLQYSCMMPKTLLCTQLNKHIAYLCKWWQNGTRCRDGVKVLWCHWFPSSLVGFLGFHPYMACFSFRKLFVTCWTAVRHNARYRSSTNNRLTFFQKVLVFSDGTSVSHVNFALRLREN